LIDQDKIRAAVASILEAIGEDPRREGLLETPRRVAEMYAELFSGIEEDPARVLETGFDEGHKEMVVLKDMQFHAICEHHFLPFYGHAHVGYIPNGRVVGASKLGRALDILGRRPQLQERLTAQLADAVFTTAQPSGVGVIIEAEHMCMTIRGVKKPGSKIVTAAMRGSFQTDPAVVRQFHALAGRVE